jgi:hypothetical protein
MRTTTGTATKTTTMSDTSVDYGALSNGTLARLLLVAESFGRADDAVEALIEISDRLDLPLDHTEQGLTPWASAEIDKFVEANRGRT